MVELFTLFGRIATNADEANRDIDGVASNAEKSEGRMGKTFKKIGAAVVTAFAVDKIIGFGKTLVETSAKMQALDSQFTQTFKGDQAKAMELINKQAKDQGINVDRLKGTWSSFYGTFRGNGADANKSLELTNNYMKLAADGAAYYDLSLEDVSGRLKSLVMGNFEAGDAIGVNINATKMDIAAKGKYKKAWQDLSDTEKEYLLIDTVGKIYKNNGAMGQGSREANNWSNVTENLKSTWERFLSVIGSPVLAGATKVVQGLTGIVERLTAKMQSFNAGKFVSAIANAFSPEFISNISNSVKWFQRLTELIEDTTFQSFAPVIGDIKEMFKNLWLVIQPVVELLGNSLINAIGTLMAIFQTFTPLVATIIDVLFKIGSTIFEAVAPAVKNIMNTVNELSDTITQVWTDYILPVIDEFILMIQKLLTENQDKLKLIGEAFKLIADFIANKVKWLTGIVQEYIIPFMMKIVDFIQNNMDNIKGIFQGALDIISGILNVFIGVFTGNWREAWEGVKQIFSGVWEVMKSGLKISVNFIKELWSKVADLLWAPIKKAQDLIGGFVQKIKDWFSNLFPDIKLPHFKIDGEFSLNPPSVPSLGVEWYAEGGILTKPTIFGMNGNRAMVGGEAGPEAVLPIEKLSDILVDTLKKLNFGGDIYIQLDGMTIAKATNPYQEKLQGKNLSYASRGLV